MSGVVSVSNGRIVVSTDNTAIGNVGDRLKIDSIVDTVSSIRPTFLVMAENVTTANNKIMLSLQNDSSSIVYINRLWIRNDQTSSVTGVVANLYLRRITGHSGGSTLIAQTVDTADALPSGITFRTNSTVTGLGSPLFYWRFSSDEWGPGLSDNEDIWYVMEKLVPHYQAPLEAKPLTARAGEGIAIRCETNTTTGVFTFIMEIMTQ